MSKLNMDTVNLFDRSQLSTKGATNRVEQDRKVAATEDEFGSRLKQFQASYGAKPKPQRVIKKELGKDDFMNIMLTQLKHQDPNKPMDAEKMATQMAQFASMEQLGNINRTLGKMATKESPSDKMAMMGLIGKTVTIDKQRFQHEEGMAEALTFSLPEKAENVRLKVIDVFGKVAFETETGPMGAGANSINWDGRLGSKLPAGTGLYYMRIEADGENGKNLMVNSASKQRVIGLRFDGPEPKLVVGTAINNSAVPISNIMQIEDLSGTSTPQTMASAQPQEGIPLPGAAERTVKASGLASDLLPKLKDGPVVDLDSLPKAATAEQVYKARPKTVIPEQILKANPQAATLARGSVVNSRDGLVEERGFPNGLSEANHANVKAEQNAVKQGKEGGVGK